MDKKLTYKESNGAIEIKSESADGVMSIRAYALAFGNVDSYGDIIMPNACDKWLASPDSKRCALCWQHQIGQVIGVIQQMGVDETGMWIEADILPTTLGKDAQILLRQGAIKEFSIGYYADEVRFGKSEDREIRYLDAISIIEVSPVTRAANDRAVLTGIKAEDYKVEIAKLSDEQLDNLSKAVADEINNRIVSHI